MSTRRYRWPAVWAAFAWPIVAACLVSEGGELPKCDGYRGVWYANQPTGDAYGYKYSGGMATYPQQHVPIAMYAQAVNKTFFVYGGADGERSTLLHMVSYFDHATGRVPRPRILLDKKTTDAHDNPTLAMDADGRLWVFSSSHGTARPSFIHRSLAPYSIDRFERVVETNFSYAQPWHLGEDGFLLLHTKYHQGRGLFIGRSQDGLAWDKPRPLAKIAQGDYQISASDGRRVATAFDFHPNPGGLNARTNLYYAESGDAGQSWRAAGGQLLTLPLTSASNPALVHDYQSEGRLVYLKDLRFDSQGRAVILYLLSAGYAPGPMHGERQWMTARWTGESWELRPAITSDHNYDHGSLYILSDGAWRVIVPTQPGRGPWTTGGNLELWQSGDQGATWTRLKQLTIDHERQHGFARQPVHFHPDFAALWADGDPLEPSGSHLYFTDLDGNRVWRLPESMTDESMLPEAVW